MKKDQTGVRLIQIHHCIEQLHQRSSNQTIRIHKEHDNDGHRSVIINQIMRATPTSLLSCKLSNPAPLNVAHTISAL
jgi:hypothetical protein